MSYKIKVLLKKHLETIGARMDKATLITITLFALNNELLNKIVLKNKMIKLLNLKMPSTH